MNDALHYPDAALDADLRAMDPADADLSQRQLAHKAQLRARLLACDPPARQRAGHAATAAAPVRLEPTRRRRARFAQVRWALPAAAAVGLGTAIVLTGGPTPSPAYASWTPTPAPVTGASLATAEQACRENLAETLRASRDAPAEERPTTDPMSARTVVAEQRGQFVFLAMSTADSSDTQCFFEASDLTKVQGSTGGLATASTPPPVPLKTGQVEAGSPGMSSGPEGSYAFVVGRVARGTTAVTVRAGGERITATVMNDHFAAWWPVPAETTGPDLDHLSPAYDVTTADGRLIPDATDVMGAKDTLEPGPDQIGRISVGGGASENGFVATLEGHAGENVTSVTIHAGSTHLSVPVSKGTFAAEWPSTEPTGPGEVTFDLHLRDGSVRTGVEPAGGLGS
ncbi:hypothetical protein [Gephyromycinifex aptenodytis]|uniref:hypothetical protein n=1 Tax=Gephyromycinifex aptenodytis TaxID=2716227 RepID=UPI001446BEA4|nr:hypothetical protein [Gephyromycinifex aptenodytis]